MKSNWIGRGLVGASLAALTLILSGCAGKPANAGPAAYPPAPVDVIAVAQEPVSLHSEWVATLDGSVNAQIQPQVTGYLVRQNYAEGSFVRKGQILFEIDPRPFEAAAEQARAQVTQAESQVAQAESQVLQSESQVAQAEAQLGKARLDVKRDTPLAQARAIAQAQLDTEIQAQAAAEAAVKAAQANLATSKAGVKTAAAAAAAAKANLAQAELNLGFTKVRSLVDGLAGIAQTQIGNLVKTDTVLTTVSQVDPVRVYFPISEKEYLAHSAKQGSLLKDSKGQSLDLILTNGETHAHRGRILFADRQVDPATGTIRIAAAFPNPGNVLRPGQFGRVRALTSVDQDALLIPQRAVTELQGKFQVAVVGAGNKVQLRTITLGPVVGGRYVVSGGLKAGERVVVEGLSKAMDGAVVAPTVVRAAGSNAGTEAQGQ